MDPSTPPPFRRRLTLARSGASQRVAADTMEAFTLAMRLGASGIESTAQALADGTAVVRSRTRLGGRLRRQHIADVSLDDLPSEVVTLDALWSNLGIDLDLLLHVADDRSLEAVVTAVDRNGVDPARVLVAHGNHDTLITWRPRTPTGLALIVAPRRAKALERLAAELQSTDIDMLGLFHQEWTAGQVALLSRFGRRTLAYGAEHERELAKLFRAGLDAISSSHPDRLAAVAANYEPPGAETGEGWGEPDR